jgi:TrmH family RNA methyltransferase
VIGQNTIKFIRSLNLKKNRQLNKKVILEGYRLIVESINAGIKIDYIVINENFQKKLLNLNKFKNQIIKSSSTSNFNKISNTKNSQGIIAIVDIKKYFNQSLQDINNENIIILDGIQDPGNLGTIFRTCVWYGIKSIVLTSNATDPFNLKCVRSAMGAHFYLNNIIQDNHINVLKYLKNNYKEIFVANMEGKNLKKIKPNNNWALILGSEAHGVNNDFKQFKQITINKIGHLESLNVSVAAGIIINNLVKHN